MKNLLVLIAVLAVVMPSANAGLLHKMASAAGHVAHAAKHAASAAAHHAASAAQTVAAFVVKH